MIKNIQSKIKYKNKICKMSKMKLVIYTYFYISPEVNDFVADAAI